MNNTHKITVRIMIISFVLFVYKRIVLSCRRAREMERERALVKWIFHRLRVFHCDTCVNADRDTNGGTEKKTTHTFFHLTKSMRMTFI